MRKAIILVSLLTCPLWAEIDSAQKEWDFAALAKAPAILYISTTEVVPALPTLTEGALYFTDCSATGNPPCQDVYRLSAAETQPQRVVEVKGVQRLFSLSGQVIVQLAGDTAFHLLQGNTLVAWKAGERTKAEAGARFHLHALAGGDASLPASIFQHPLLRPALTANGEGFGFQIFSADLQNPLLLGFLRFNAKERPTLMPFNRNSGTLVAPTPQQFYLSTQTKAADGGSLDGLDQVNLDKQTTVSLGGDPAGEVERSDELPQASWKARTITHISATPQGGLLVATSSLEPGEAGRVWYFPPDTFPEAGKVRAVRSVANSDLRSLQMTAHGILVTHATDKSIALYPGAGAFETAALAPWKKKAELLTKNWNIFPKQPCAAYAVVKQGENWEIRFRERGADGVPSYRSLLSFTPASPGAAWVCDPKQGPVFLASALGLNLASESLQLQLDNTSLYGSNSTELAKVASRGASYSAAGDLPRLSSEAVRFRWESPSLFQLRGRVLSLARVPLAGSRFASLTAAQDTIEVRLQTTATPPVPFEEYMHAIPYGTAEFLPVNYIPEPKP